MVIEYLILTMLSRGSSCFAAKIQVENSISMPRNLYNRKLPNEDRQPNETHKNQTDLLCACCVVVSQRP